MATTLMNEMDKKSLFDKREWIPRCTPKELVRHLDKRKATSPIFEIVDSDEELGKKRSRSTKRRITPFSTGTQGVPIDPTITEQLNAIAEACNHDALIIADALKRLVVQLSNPS
jgi:hypothetical protein